MAQRYGFGISDTVAAETGGVSLKDFHFDANAICQAWEKVAPIAKRLGVDAPVPAIAGFAYNSVAALGAEVVFPEDGEPNVLPLIASAKDIDKLKEPKDYLAAGLIQKRLAVLDELKKRRPDANSQIGHLYEGPVTTAMLIMGHDFLMLPYDDPERAHKLLEFSTRTSIEYAKAMCVRLGVPVKPGPRGIPDDFAGMFPPAIFGDFVAKYWDKLYKGMEATRRHLHSELLRVEHMPFLKDLKIDVYDPSADQFVTPELLKEHCPCAFECRIQSWHVRDMSAIELVEMYKHLASFKPHIISFYMTSLSEEPKIRAILDVAKKLAAA